ILQMVRWFGEEGDGSWQISDKLRDMVRFEVRNIVERPPEPKQFDMILCRNVLLYFAPDMRRLAFSRMADALAPHGALMLGAAETVIGQTDRFVSDPENRGLYVPQATAAASRRVA
ncbi:MAG TPA: CheR family methyltransferase, partial [Allosphingosinicella sp.]